MTNRKDLPSEKASNFQQRLRETVMTYLGKQGDPLDRGITLRDLISSGIAKLPNGWRGGSDAVPLSPGSFTVDADSVTLDLTPPPMPTGVEVTAAITNLMISTDSPIYRAGGGHLSMVVYGQTYVAGGAVPVFGTAVRLAEIPGAIGSYATNPSTTWHIWVTWKSKAGVEGPPAGGTNGFVATTGENVELLLNALSGQITQSQLYSDLGSRIDLIDGPQSLAGSVAARIFSERQERVAAITAEQQARTNALLAEAADRGTAISNETDQRITATGALQSQINLLSAASSGDFTELLSAVQEEQAARIEGDLAEATQRTTLAAQHVALVDVVAHGAELDEVNRLGGEVLVAAERVRASASLDVERIVRADADEAMASQITTLSARMGSAEAGLVSEQTTRASADSALSTSITNLTATVQSNNSTLQANITQEATARANADEVVSNTLTALISQTGAAANAAIVAEQQARTTAISAETSARNAQVATLQTADSNLSAAIVSEATLRLADDVALGQRIDALGVEVDGNAAAIINEATARASGDSSLSSQINTVSAVANAANRSYLQPSAPTGDLKVGDIWWDSDDNKKSYRWNGSGWGETADTRIAANAAAITNEATARANSDGALAQSINQVQARLDTGDYAAVKVQSSATATKVGTLITQYSVKLDAGGKVAGFGLYNDSTTGSEFAIRADRFYIAPPATGGGSATQIMPFVVQASATTIGGVSVPAGVYINDAYIRNGTISNAKIANATIDKAKIVSLGVDQLDAGSLNVGQYIQSQSYAPGWSGWRITADGAAEFSNAVVRGTVYATNGSFTGTVYATDGDFKGKVLGGGATTYTSGTGMFSGWTSGTTDANYRWRVGNPSGARIQWTGSGVEVYNSSNQLTLSSGGVGWDSVSGKPAFGSLATQSSVTTGQVSGLGSLATQSSVNWSTQISNIPAFGNFAYLSSITSANISTFIAGAAIGEAYISNAAITRAKIENAAVNTLKIAGNAVTVPSVDTRGDTVNGSGAYVEVGRVTISMSEPGWIYASFCATQNYGSGMRNSASFLEITGDPVMTAGGLAVTTNISIAGAKYLGAGSHVIRAIWYGENSGVRIINRVLFAMGVMR